MPKTSEFHSGDRVAKQVLNTMTNKVKNQCFRYISPQKSPKIAQKRITQSQFAQIFFIGMVYFFMVRGESSCPDGSEFVWERGVRGLYGRPKLTLVSTFVAA